MSVEALATQNDRDLLSEKVKRQMNKPLIHQSWESTYRSEENERLFDGEYNAILASLGQPPDSLALDIGSGIGANSVRLARHGYRVVAGDYSESILEPARQNLAEHGVADRVDVRREDILNLSFPDAKFDLVLCWGVLMHVPSAAPAIAQLSRVVKPGGYIVLEEINARAPEALLMRTYWRLFKRKSIQIVKTPAGFEHQSRFGGDTLFWRHANKQWLVEQFALHSCQFVASKPGMFTELYQFVPGKMLRSMAHAWNRRCLARVKSPRLAYHNTLVFKKS
jgi:2-polyprenyl-3-methyl-5-hydroxy-6-metoxy-1,4-benzoquinol methylase